MDWKSIGEMVLMVLGSIGAAVVFVWRLRPSAEKFIDARVDARVDPLLVAINGVSAQLAVQEEERQRFHLSTTSQLAEMKGALGGLRNDVDRNTDGNLRGRDGLNELREKGDRLAVRARDLEIKAGLRNLGDAMEGAA